MRLRAAWIVAALAASTPLQAADWTRVAAKDQHEHYYDRGKLAIDGEQITYWRRVVFRPVQPTRNGIAASAMYRERIDCALHTHRTLGYLLYAQDGGVLDNVYTPEAPAEPIVPETVGDRFENAMCTLVARERSRNVAKREAQKQAAETAQSSQDDTLAAPPARAQQDALTAPEGTDPMAMDPGRMDPEKLDPEKMDQVQLLAEIARLEARLAQLRARVLQMNAPAASVQELPPTRLPDPVVLQQDEPRTPVLPAGTPTP